MLVYEIYSRLKAADILGKYSVHDFVIHLKYIQRHCSVFADDVFNFQRRKCNLGCARFLKE